MTIHPHADADWLDDAWDAAGAGSGSDPELTPILHALHATDPAAAPDVRWMHALENRLMQTMATPHSGVLAPPPVRGALPNTAAPPPLFSPRSVPRLAPVIATAALLLLTLIVGLAGLRDGRRPPGKTVPAVAQTTAIAELNAVTCDVAPRTGELLTGDPTAVSVFPLPVNGAPQSPIEGQMLPETGEPLEDAAIDGIATILAELHACQTGGEVERELALYSADLLRRTDGLRLTWRIPEPDAYRIDNIRSFGDGRVMATLVEPSWAGAFVVLTRDGGRWLIDEVAIFARSPIPAATETTLPSCAAAELPADLAPPAAGVERPAGLIPFDPDQVMMAGPFSSEYFNLQPFTGADAEPQTVAAVNAMLASLVDCAVVDDATAMTPDVRYPTTPRLLAFFSPDFFARGRIDVLPDPWWAAYPIQFGWTEWSLPAAKVRQLGDDRVLVLVDSIASPTDHAALILALRDGSWLIDEMAYVSDDPAVLDPRSDCALQPADPRTAPDWAQSLAYESVLPAPVEDNAWLDDSPLADEQKGRRPATIDASATSPTGAPVDAETRAGIAAAITDFIACRGVIDDPQRMGRTTVGYARAFELMSDDLFRRFQPAQPLDPRWWDSFSVLNGIAPNALDPAWLDALQRLPDGRVLALLAPNRTGAQYQAMVFVEVDGQWLIDEFAWIGHAMNPPMPTPEPADGARATSLEVSLSELIFTPNQIEIPAGQEVTVTLINQGVVQHSFVIAELGVSQEVAPGESVNVRIAAPAGTYRFVCAVPGHADAGMTGVLTVVDAPATPTG